MKGSQFKLWYIAFDSFHNPFVLRDYTLFDAWAYFKKMTRADPEPGNCVFSICAGDREGIALLDWKGNQI